MGGFIGLGGREGDELNRKGRRGKMRMERRVV